MNTISMRLILLILAITLTLTSTSCEADIGKASDTSNAQASAATDDPTTQNSETTTVKEPNMTPFYNPISPYDAPDPFMTYDPETEYYYAIFTQGNRLELFRSKQAANVLTDRDSFIVQMDLTVYGAIYGHPKCTAARTDFGTYTPADV